MNDADTIIETIRSLEPEEKRKVREFIYTEGETELRQRVQEGIDAIDRGEVVDAEDAFARLKQTARHLAENNQIMSRLVLSSLAEQDLTAILDYISKDNPKLGIEYIEKIEAKCSLLASNEQIGKPRPDLGEGIRTFPVGNYLIIYRNVNNQTQIIRIVSGYRDIRALFEQLLKLI